MSDTFNWLCCQTSNRTLTANVPGQLWEIRESDATLRQLIKNKDTGTPSARWGAFLTLSSLPWFHQVLEAAAECQRSDHANSQVLSGLKYRDWKGSLLLQASTLPREPKVRSGLCPAWVTCLQYSPLKSNFAAPYSTQPVEKAGHRIFNFIISYQGIGYKPTKNIKERLLETGIYRYTTQKPKSYHPIPKPSLWERMALAKGQRSMLVTIVRVLSIKESSKLQPHGHQNVWD